MAAPKPTNNPLEEINKLQAQIASLREAAADELKARRSVLEAELKAVDAELEKLTGKPPRVKRARGGATGGGEPSVGKKPDLQELKALLASAPNRTISLRKEGYDVRNVKVLAAANPHLFQMGGKGPWPQVTLR